MNSVSFPDWQKSCFDHLTRGCRLFVSRLTYWLKLSSLELWMAGANTGCAMWCSLPNFSSHLKSRLSSYCVNCKRGSVAKWLACRRAWVQNAVATLSGNSLRQTVHTHCASVHLAAKSVASHLIEYGLPWPFYCVTIYYVSLWSSPFHMRTQELHVDFHELHRL